MTTDDGMTTTEDVASLRSWLREREDEIRRLRARLRYQEDREGWVGSHSTECWSWGPSHYECALREIKRLRAELDDQRKDTVCDEQRIADLMADVQRQGLEIERLRGLLRRVADELGRENEGLAQMIREALGGSDD